MEPAHLLSRSPFTVGEVEEDPTVTTQGSPKHFAPQGPMAMELGTAGVSALSRLVVPELSRPVVLAISSPVVPSLVAVGFSILKPRGLSAP